jgi:PLP dependent protein
MKGMTTCVSRNLDALAQELPAHRPVTLVVVSKYATADQMVEAFRWGVRDFGENRIQDVENKLKELPAEMRTEVRWHFLGHLQRNKAKKAVEMGFHLIHSLDSMALAQKLSVLSQEHSLQQPVLVQLNLTQEPQKTGFSEDALHQIYPQLIALPGLTIQGLMTIGPHPVNVNESKQIFCHLHDLRDRLVQAFGHPLPQLSMGMSQDFQHAIECGATIIRIGNRIFGSR